MLSNDSQFTITCCGVIEEWNFYAGVDGSIIFQVWRHNGTVWQLTGGELLHVYKYVSHGGRQLLYGIQ